MKVKLEDVCEKGTSNLKLSDVVDKNGDYPIYGASGYIGNVDFYKQESPYVAVVKDGAGIGRAILCPAKSSVIGTMQYLIPKSNILPEYLYYVVSSLHLEKYFSGATIPHIYFRDYKDETFNLHPLTQQYKIVNILNHVENMIQFRNKELQLLNELIKSRFVEMFGDINTNSKNWLSKPLGKICNIYRGGSPRPIANYLGGIIPWIKIGDVTKGDDIYLSSTKEYITQDGVQKSRMVKKGSLIFANCGVSLGFTMVGYH